MGKISLTRASLRMLCYALYHLDAEMNTVEFHGDKS